MVRRVGVFATEQDVYDTLGRLFEEMVADPELGPHFQRADTIVQYRYRDPEATITVDIRASAEPHVEFGATDLESEVVMSMDADTAHQLFLGDLNLTLALARGLIQRQGSVTKILKLVPLVKPVFPRYRERVEAAQRSRL
jgi:hypothetical protein